MSDQKINIGIIGTGKIGTDLLLKTERSKLLKCSFFVGRNAHSKGIRKASELGIKTSYDGINSFLENPDICDMVFDATSASSHKTHAPVFSALGIRTIDLTPAKIGPFCIPSLNANQIFMHDNVNLITCGGQASIPVLNCIAQNFSGVKKIEVQSHVAKNAIGPATIANIDDYYATTTEAIGEFTQIPLEDIIVDLEVDHSTWNPDMLTSIRAVVEGNQLDKFYIDLYDRVQAIKKYIPGYNIVGTPTLKNNVLEIRVSVRGAGDWMPCYAGNLDIINSAAIYIAEIYSAAYLQQPIDSTNHDKERVLKNIA